MGKDALIPCVRFVSENRGWAWGLGPQRVQTALENREAGICHPGSAVGCGARPFLSGPVCPTCRMRGGMRMVPSVVPSTPIRASEERLCLGSCADPGQREKSRQTRAGPLVGKITV